MTIDTLIDKQDNVEIVRDQVAAILAVESAAQVALATAAGKPDPDLWALRVYQERSNIWENLPSKKDDTRPVVNIWWDSSTFDAAASNVMEQQKASATINIDCYASGQSTTDGGTGQISGDQAAAEAVQRAVRLVRNILMAAEYSYLDLRGTVSRRRVDSITMLQLRQQDSRSVEQIIAARVALRVEFNELSPQVVPVVLEYLSTQIRRTEDSELIVEADYDYTT